MKNQRRRAGPAVATMLCVMMVCIGFLCAGCLSVYEYDPNSHTHSLQSQRNVDDVNNGLDDAAVDAKIEEGWNLCRSLNPDATDEEVAVARAAFYDGLRSYAVTDIEVEIDKRQATAWVDYEDGKRPDEIPPPEIGTVGPGD